MRHSVLGLAAAAVAAAPGVAQPPHARPDPDRPFTVISGYSPDTGGYSNTEYFSDLYTGQPVARGYGYAPWPAPAAYPDFPPASGFGYGYDQWAGYPAPAVGYGPPAPGWRWYVPATPRRGLGRRLTGW